MRKFLIPILTVFSASSSAFAIASDCYEAPSGRTETTILMQARLGQTECLRKYMNVSWEIDFNTLDMEKKTPLHVAAELSNDQGLEIVKMLLQKKVDLDIKDIYNNSALCTSAYSSAEVSKALIEAGAYINISCQNSALNYTTTPLYEVKDLELAQYMIQKGADVRRSHAIVQVTNWSMLHEDQFRTGIDNRLEKFIKLYASNGADLHDGIQEALRLAKISNEPVESFETYRLLVALSKQ